MILITGGAGFIGCNLIRYLNSIGRKDIVVVEDVDNCHIENLSGVDIAGVVSHIATSSPQTIHNLDTIVHLGAMTNTGEPVSKKLYDVNYKLPLDYYNFCKENNINFIYASSASVYGNPLKPSSESDTLNPLNPYAVYKALVDTTLFNYNISPKATALRFFNVYGPYEKHKGSMASMVYQLTKRKVEGALSTLLFGKTPNYSEGEQKRDFVCVEDVCKVITHFINNPTSGIFNVGCGKANSFNTICDILWGLDRKHAFIPTRILPYYQEFTEADITNLRIAGYTDSFIPLPDGIAKLQTWMENNRFLV